MLACRPPASLETAPPASGKAQVPVAVAEPAPEPLPAAKGPLELLPARTAAVFEIRSPARLLVELGLPEVLTHGGLVSQGAQMMVDAETRALIEDPERLREYGVDPTGSMGVALLDASAGAFVAWISLSDPQRAVETLEARSGRSLEFRGSRGGQVARLSDADDIVLRDGIMLFVHVDAIDRAPLDYARAVADADPRVGLASDDDFRAAFADGDAALARTYLVPRELLAALRRSADGLDWQEASRLELERTLEQMRASGAPAAEIQRMEAELDYLRQSIASQRSKDDAAWKLAGDVLEPIRFVAANMNAGPGRMWADIAVKLDDSQAMLRRIFGETGRPSRLLEVLELPPGAVGELGFDPDELYTFVRRFAEANDEDFARFEAELQRELNLDLRRDVFGNLAGFGGGAVYFDGPPKLGAKRPADEQVDFAVSLELRDEAKMNSTLAAMARKARDPAMKKDRSTGGWSIEVDKEMTVRVAVLDGALWVSSDLALMRRVSAGKSGGAMAKLERVELRAPFEAKDPFARGFLEFAFPIWLASHGVYPRTIEDFERRFHYYRDLGPERAEKVAWSSTTRRKKARLAKLYKKLNAGEIAERQAEVEAQVALARRFGHLNAHGRRSADGLEGTIELVHEGKTFMGLVLDFVDASQQASEGDPDLRGLRDEVRDLEYEIEQDRYRELDRWMEKHPDQSAPAFPIP